MKQKGDWFQFSSTHYINAKDIQWGMGLQDYTFKGFWCTIAIKYTFYITNDKQLFLKAVLYMKSVKFRSTEMASEKESGNKLL